jgi:low temperature requirement protein LtrA
MAANPNPKTSSLFRVRGGADGERVENIELFFDLVFVFAVTRLSHALLSDLTATGAFHVGLLTTAVWWVWIYTSWVTNWLAPERLPVRLCLFAMMGAGLLLSVAIPHAFGDYAMVFATCYVAMQVGRTLFFLRAARCSLRCRHRPGRWRSPSSSSRRRCSTGCQASGARIRGTGTSRAATWRSAARCS